jgi:putative ABC transport system substrate-binding protein
VRRREFIIALLAGAGWPYASRAQQVHVDRIRRIGVLVAPAEDDPETRRRLALFETRLEEAGWTGRNIRIEYRWAAGDPDRMQQLAKELVALQLDAIVAGTSRPASLLRQETRTIPIVFIFVSDPIGSGLVESMARPGGNATGFTDVEASLSGKWVELLKEIAPQVERVAFLFNPDTMSGGGAYFLRPFEVDAPRLGTKPIAAAVRSPADIHEALAELARHAGGGVIVAPDVFTRVHRELIITLTAQHRLPAIYPFRYFTAEGGLISYGVDPLDLYPRAAVYVDRILRGERPSELPVQAPAKFELAINLKATKALGLSVPPSLLARSDEVIE